MDKDIHTTLALVHTAPDGERDVSFYRNLGADMALTEGRNTRETDTRFKSFSFWYTFHDTAEINDLHPAHLETVLQELEERTTEIIHMSKLL